MAATVGDTNGVQAIIGDQSNNPALHLEALQAAGSPVYYIEGKQFGMATSDLLYWEMLC